MEEERQPAVHEHAVRFQATGLINRLKTAFEFAWVAVSILLTGRGTLTFRKKI